jgi:hydroxymethylbilane synthase
VVDATLLALAGLKRLGMDDVISSSQVVSWEDMLPAVSQGAIGIQCRSDDKRALDILAQLNHQPTKVAVDCERAFLECLDGNCRTPIAGQAKIVDGKLHFQGLISMPDGTRMIRVTKVGDPKDAVSVGKDAGNEVRRIAGDKFKDYAEANQVVLDATAAENAAAKAAKAGMTL